MYPPRRSDHPPTHSVGGEHAWRPSWGYLALALMLVAGGIAYLVMSPSSPTEQTDRSASTAAPSASTSQVAQAWPIQAHVPVPEAPALQRDTRPTREGDNDPTPDLSNYVARGEKPTMNEVIDRLHQAGIRTGLGAFNPPGTRPPLVGLAVPEDFVLPPGYVRHHQATDDGQRIEAILMFAPDHQFLDAANKPIEIPKDRVVPPELAPPGLPIRRIVIPAPIDPGRSGL